MTLEGVTIVEEPITIPTYRLGAPDPNPIFFSGRSYQGAKGPVYPYAMLDRVSDVREDRTYKSIRLENEYIQAIALPELGGRLLGAQDKTNAYDFFYRQHVVKPALIGVLGAWVSGGVEWNVPHHHRASTFLPVDHCIRENPDGSKTLWVGETELRHRMRWIVGVTLFPGRSYLQVTTKLINRTPYAWSFLCFANAAVSVNEQYQVIFPPGTQFGTQHAKVEFVHWPIGRETYAGVDYSAGVDMSWWKNHPNHISVFAWNYEDDFVGGYDHGRRAGVCHVADHHAAPGKKFFEFGNGPAGRMWDKILTDEDGPYLELMAGAYSDNQPDYSWIAPGETKSVTEYWYPIRELGGIKNANRDAAINLDVDNRGVARVALNATADHNATVLIKVGDRTVMEERIHIAPQAPFVREVPLGDGVNPEHVRVSLLSAFGEELIAYRPTAPRQSPMPKPVSPPPPPAEIKTNEELYLAGLRVEQFHSPALEPYPYYEEALRRDPGDARANTALGILYCKRGMFAEAAEKLQTAIDRVSANYTAPKDGEAYYYLGVAARAMHDDQRARDAFGKAAWSFAWRAASELALAEIATADGDWESALVHIEDSLAHHARNPKTLNLKAVVLRCKGHIEEAATAAEQASAMDPLDAWSFHERLLASRALGKASRRDEQGFVRMLRGSEPAYLELSCDYMRIARWDEAIEVLQRATRFADPAKPAPMLHYLSVFCRLRKRGPGEPGLQYRRARQAVPDYCFPFQIESAEALRSAMEHDPADPHAPYYLGNLLFDIQPEEAIRAWERSRELDDAFATVHRNLALAYARVRHDLPKAVAGMKRAIELAPQDARLLVEMDELLEAQGAPHAERLAMLESHHDVASQRDDAVLREARLNVLLGRYDRAIELLSSRHFHIWEGGESNVHDVYVDAHLLRGREHLAAGKTREALADFRAATEYPERFERGEPYDGGRAPEVYYFIGLAQEACGEDPAAAYERAVSRPRKGVALAYFQALAWRKLGQEAPAVALLEDLSVAGRRMLESAPGESFFEKFGFGQSDASRRAMGHYLIALAHLGLGNEADAKRELQAAVRLDPNLLGARTELARLAT